MQIKNAPSWDKRTALYLFAIGFCLGVAAEAYRDSLAWGKMAEQLKSISSEIELQSIIQAEGGE